MSKWGTFWVHVSEKILLNSNQNTRELKNMEQVESKMNEPMLQILLPYPSLASSSLSET